MNPYRDETISNVKDGCRQALLHEHPLRSLCNGFYSKSGDYLPFLKIHDVTPNSDTFVESFLDWIKNDVSEDAWAACLNLMDAHYPYKPDKEFDNWGSEVLHEIQDDWGESQYDSSEFTQGKRPWWQLGALESLYDGSIRQVDHYLDIIVRSLKSMGEFENTCIVISSDHGECFGERSYFDSSSRIPLHGHEGGIHEHKVHVPLVVKPPGRTPNSGHIDRPVSLTLFPSLVRDAVRGEPVRTSLMPDGPVIVSTNQKHKPTGLAIYDKNGDEVEVRMRFGDNAIEGHIRGSQGICIPVTTSLSDFEEIQSGFSDANICKDQNQPLNENTKDRLADLGYI
jgi:arylsulfatase